jgi:hypothetical protein
MLELDKEEMGSYLMSIGFLSYQVKELWKWVVMMVVQHYE